MLPSGLQTTPNQEVHGTNALEFKREIHEERNELFWISRLAFHLRIPLASSNVAEPKFCMGDGVMISRANEKNKKFEEDIICFTMLFYKKDGLRFLIYTRAIPFSLVFYFHIPKGNLHNVIFFHKECLH